MRPTRDLVVVPGPGPRWLRLVLVVAALLYFLALVVQPAHLQPVTFFSQCTKLFPAADTFALEYRLEGWSCGARTWEPLDPRPYFPMEADDKESRFQRIAYFYADLAPSRPAMRALGAYIVAHHAAGAADGVTGAIGGIRVYVVRRPIPELGEPVARYVYSPLAAVPPEWRKDLYWTPESLRAERCDGSPARQP